MKRDPSFRDLLGPMLLVVPTGDKYPPNQHNGVGLELARVHGHDSPQLQPAAKGELTFRSLQFA